jgi:thiosulfate/3-mercaptopyruvate sulfurtransferase
VVVVNKTDNLTELANAARVVKTLVYGGVGKVGILNGGYTLWVKEKRPVSQDAVKAKAVEYKGKVNKEVLASKDYVMSKIGKSSIVDTRGPEFFFGVAKLPFVGKAGHITKAVSLPSAWIFTPDGTFKNKDDLQAIAGGVVGKDVNQELIVYCDTGRVCSGWWFVLREVLDYKNVKSYDGSMQEWGKDPNAPVTMYSWQN